MQFTGSWRRAVLGVAAVLVLGPLASGQDTNKKPQDKANKPEDKAFTDQMEQAVARAAKYLRGLQKPDGSWPHHARDATAMVGLALLEAGVPAGDEAIRKAAAVVRAKACKDTFNYSVSAAIMFLDRLGDPQDEPFIQALAVRVLAAQFRQGGADAGGWAYECPAPTAAEVQRLSECLKNRKEPEGKQGPARRPQPPPKEVLDQIDALYTAQSKPVMGGTPDNSNTQFALLALWVARRHGIPVERAFALAEQRLRATQHTNGGWGYRSGSVGAGTSPTAQMTCCGLIGLGLAHGAAALKRDLSKDEAIRKGLKAIAGTVGVPANDLRKVPRLTQPGSGHIFYTLWSLERMAVLYDIPTLMGKDWHRWGAQILLVNQQADGSWKGSYPEGGCDTAFAVLFLKRANVAADLTERFKKDPSRPGLLEGIQEPTPKRRTPPQSGPAPKRGPSSFSPAPRGPSLRGKEFAVQHLGGEDQGQQVLRDILATLPPKERRAGLSLEERLEDLSPEELERLQQLLQTPTKADVALTQRGRDPSKHGSRPHCL
jgi:hypothetical protein